MSEFPIACQTITFGETQKEHFPEIFGQVKAAGYEGVEIGIRHVANITPDALAQLLDEAGLALTALHLGGNLLDLNQADGERNNLDYAIQYMKVAGTSTLMYSGLRGETDEELHKNLDMLNKAAELAKAQGMSLLYHNHNWEFEKDGRIIKALINDSSKALGFCPDIGWVMRGGWDTVEFLEKIKGRVGALHFKDFAEIDGKWETVMLGEGVAPLKEAAEWAKKNTSGMWAIAEQDRAAVPPDQAVAQNAEYMRSLF